MRGRAVCLLSILTAFNAVRGELPILNEPTNLAIESGNKSAAVLVWNFVKPKNVPLSEIQFVVVLESDGTSERNFYTNFEEPPFKYTLSGLSLSSFYTVKVRATTAHWQDSPTTEISFAGSKIDLPTPVITQVHRTPHEDFVLYTVKWKFDDRSQSLRYFRVEVCYVRCSELRKKRESRDVTLQIKYEKDFTITVSAVYEWPTRGLILRTSTPYSANSGESSLTKTLNTLGVEHVGHKVKLPLLSQSTPLGPIPYYEFFIRDKGSPPEVLNELFNINEAASTTKPRELPLSLNSSIFEMDFSGDAFQSRYSEDPEANQCLSGPPPHFEVVKKTTSALRFRLFFRNPFINRPGSRSRSKGSQVFKLAPYTVFRVKIRSCLTDFDDSGDVCGDFSEFDSLSNVEGPSRVRNLEQRSKHGEDGLEITWQPPEQPRGPIDGYKLVVNEEPPTAEEERMYKLNSTTLSYFMEERDPWTTYEIKVSAYNLDLDEEDKEVEGEWSYLTVVAEKRGIPWPFGVGSLATAVVLTCVVCCLYKLESLPRPVPVTEDIPLAIIDMEDIPVAKVDAQHPQRNTDAAQSVPSLGFNEDRSGGHVESLRFARVPRFLPVADVESLPSEAGGSGNVASRSPRSGYHEFTASVPDERSHGSLADVGSLPYESIRSLASAHSSSGGSEFESLRVYPSEGEGQSSGMSGRPAAPRIELWRETLDSQGNEQDPHERVSGIGDDPTVSLDDDISRSSTELPARGRSPRVIVFQPTGNDATRALRNVTSGSCGSASPELPASMPGRSRDIHSSEDDSTQPLEDDISRVSTVGLSGEQSPRDLVHPRFGDDVTYERLEVTSRSSESDCPELCALMSGDSRGRSPEVPAVTLTIINTEDERAPLSRDNKSGVSTVSLDRHRSPPDPVSPRSEHDSTKPLEGFISRVPTVRLESEGSLQDIASSRSVSVSTRAWDDVTSRSSGSDFPEISVAMPEDSRERSPGLSTLSLSSGGYRRDVIEGNFSSQGSPSANSGQQSLDGSYQPSGDAASILSVSDLPETSPVSFRDSEEKSQ